MNLLLLDFESYYDKDYSLGKMPTMQYIRDERWQTLGCALQGLPVSDRPVYLRPGELEPALDSIPWDTTCAVAHNAAFDGAVLKHHYGHAPAQWIDTMLLMRWAIGQGHLPADLTTRLAAAGDYLGIQKGDTRAALDAGGEAEADYACQDVRIMAKLLKLLLSFRPPLLERLLVDLHVRMAAEPVLEIDQQMLEETAKQKPDDAAVALRKKAIFASALRAKGIEPEMKTSPRTGKQDYAFAKKDPFMQTLAEHGDPVVRHLHKLRTEGTSNLLQTRAQRFLEVGSPFPVPLLYYGAHTGRASGLDRMNLQNLPRKGPLRAAIAAPEGFELVVIDLAQIEVRVLAWLAGERWLLDAFAKGEDVYTVFAANELYHKPQADVTKAERTVAKAAVLALGFGQGALGFVEYCQAFGIPMDQRQAEGIVRAYRDSVPAITAHWRHTMDTVIDTQQTRLPSGRVLTYPNLRQQGREWVFDRHQIFSKQRVGQRDVIKLWHGIVVENQVQAAARDVVMAQTIHVAEHYRVVLSVHDELVMCVPTEQAEEALAFAEGAFAQPPEWADGLPVKGEGGIGQTYADAKAAAG